MYVIEGPHLLPSVRTLYHTWVQLVLKSLDCDEIRYKICSAADCDVLQHGYLQLIFQQWDDHTVTSEVATLTTKISDI